MTLRIGTRSSRLALTQTRLVAEALLQTLPTLDYSVIPITTTGDIIKDRPLYDIGGKALFCRELDQALLRQDIDISVHSMKDVPTELPPGISIAAVLPRADIRDTLIGAEKLSDLPVNATVGTSSLRRKAQLLKHRPDLNIVSLRGNVPRRLQVVVDGHMHGTILAQAGLDRLKQEHPGLVKDCKNKPIPIEAMLPAAGQGCVGILCLTEKLEEYSFLQQINHVESLLLLKAERAFLEAINGSCRTPAAACSTIKDNRLSIKGLLVMEDGTETVYAERQGLTVDAMLMGREVGKEILANASPALIASISL